VLKLARQGALSKPWRNWCQGPTCSWEKVLEDTRSSPAKNGPNRAKKALGWPAWAVFSPVRAPLWPSPSPVYLKPRCKEPLINSFIIHRWGAEKRAMRTMCGSRTSGWSLPCVMSDWQRCVDW
jgi:hypothetical protein